jgi:hypothetical protein
MLFSLSCFNLSPKKALEKPLPLPKMRCLPAHQVQVYGTRSYWPRRLGLIAELTGDSIPGVPSPSKKGRPLNGCERTLRQTRLTQRVCGASPSGLPPGFRPAPLTEARNPTEESVGRSRVAATLHFCVVHPKEQFLSPKRDKIDIWGLRPRIAVPDFSVPISLTLLAAFHLLSSQV